MNAQTPNTAVTALQKPIHRKRLWPRILLGIVILICGIVIGTGGTMIVIGKTVHRIFEHPEDLPQMMTKNMTRRFNLSETQAAEVENILDKRIENVLEIMRDIHPLLHEEFQNMHDEISEILNDKQKKTWEKRFKRFHKLIPPPNDKDND